MYVHSLTLRDLRSFVTADLTLRVPSAVEKPNEEGGISNVTLLLGDNGAGKSTVQKAIALLCLAEVMPRSGYTPFLLVRRAPSDDVFVTHASIEGRLSLESFDLPRSHEGPVGPFEKEISVERTGDYESLEHDDPPTGFPANVLYPFFQDESPGIFMLGYGATRRTEHVENVDAGARKRRGLRYQRVAGLFEDYIALRPMGIWLPGRRSSSPERFDETVAKLNDLLPDDTRFEGQFEDLEPVFIHHGVSLPFSALSDGYRGWIGLLGDMLFHLNDVTPEPLALDELPGVVLIDDVDLHLHPSWQLKVVPQLSRAFPRLQFVLTSHSPLVAGSLKSENVRLVERDEHGHSIVRQMDESLHGLNADQVLISSYFGLSSTRAPDFVERLEAKARDIAVDEDRDPRRAIEFLKRLTHGSASEADDSSAS